MATQLHNELKKEFQLERLILFSDAVFAIAITLLAIEIKIPDKIFLQEHGGVSDATILVALGNLVPKFVGFLISFMLVGMYWTIHHRMFGFVTNYDRKLLFLNLVFLFFIALMPFSTGFYSEFTGGELSEKQLKVPMTFYVLNFFFIGMVSYFMWRRIGNLKNKLAEPPIDPLILKLAYVRSLLVPFIFLSMLPIAYFTNVLYAVWMPMFIPLIISIVKKMVKKKHNKISLKESI
ncbi:MAG TPA: TMEM175 family protein [Chitinophagaceae bacterium]|nr:TMEM175 family protein [Chitinophagaceae bacterium]